MRIGCRGLFPLGRLMLSVEGWHFIQTKQLLYSFWGSWAPLQVHRWGLPLGEGTLQTLFNFNSRQSLGTPAGETLRWTERRAGFGASWIAVGPWEVGASGDTPEDPFSRRPSLGHSHEGSGPECSWEALRNFAVIGSLGSRHGSA